MSLAVDDLGDGHPVVLLHAGIADRRMWRDQVPALVAGGHRVLAYDLPGYGGSPLPQEPFVLHEPVAEALAARGIERATVVGCSFGGRFALDLTLDHPELVNGLVLLGSALGGAPAPDDLRAAVETATAGLDDKDLAGLARAEVQLWVVGVDRPRDSLPPELIEFAEEMDRAALAAEAALDEADVEELDPPAAGRLAEIAVPVWATTGAHDLPTIRRQSDRIAAEVQHGTRLPDIANAAHLPSLDNPTAVTRILLDFLESHRRP